MQLSLQKLLIFNSYNEGKVGKKLNFEKTTVNKKDQVSKPNGTEPTINAALLYSLNDGMMKILNFCKTTLWEKSQSLNLNAAKPADDTEQTNNIVVMYSLNDILDENFEL